jgi:ribosomal protein S18 acetylase RimI-like enzyme
VNIVAMRADDVDALIEFFRAVPEGDLTFVKEDVADPAAVAGWVDTPGWRWLALDAADDTAGGDRRIVGFVAVLPLSGWSDHVGELRLVVHPQRRGAGVGRQLARHALTSAVAAGLKKVVVELPAEQEPAIAMFSGLGFTGEALLRDHIRDRDGQLHDLVMLAHLVDEAWANLAAVGLTEEAGIGGN